MKTAERNFKLEVACDRVAKTMTQDLNTKFRRRKIVNGCQFQYIGIDSTEAQRAGRLITKLYKEVRGYEVKLNRATMEYRLEINF